MEFCLVLGMEFHGMFSMEFHGKRFPLNSMKNAVSMEFHGKLHLDSEKPNLHLLSIHYCVESKCKLGFSESR